MSSISPSYAILYREISGEEKKMGVLHLCCVTLSVSIDSEHHFDRSASPYCPLQADDRLREAPRRPQR